MLRVWRQYLLLRLFLGVYCVTLCIVPMRLLIKVPRLELELQSLLTVGARASHVAHAAHTRLGSV